MSTVSQYRHGSVLLLVGIITLGMFASACGGAGTDDQEPATNLGDATIGVCLERAGARFAQDVDELKFLSEAEAADEVSEYGLAFDRSADLVVNTWSAATVEGGPPTWLIWLAHPFGSQANPSAILEDDSTSTYVAYVEKPSRELRRKVESCIDFSEPNGGEPPTMLDREDFERGEVE